MPTEAKEATVARAKESSPPADRPIVADYRGLTVSELSAVRRNLREQGITLRVVKNRLAKIAAHEAGRDELTRCSTGRPAWHSAATTRSRWPGVPRRRPAIPDAHRARRASSAASSFDGAAVTRLATLPPREVLLAQLAGGFASPLAAWHRCCRRRCATSASPCSSSPPRRPSRPDQPERPTRSTSPTWPQT